MTAVSLFDVLARDDGLLHPTGGNVDSPLPLFAERLVASSLGDLERIREYEEQFVFTRKSDSYAADLEIIRPVWQMYEQWAIDAEMVLSRARSVSSPGETLILQSNRLDSELGQVQARLKLSPEQIAKAKQQVREGQFIPAKDLRDDLRSRLRA